MSRNRIASLVIAAVALVIVAVVAATKGGGGSKHARPKVAKAAAPANAGPQPRETLARFEQRLAAAISSPSCRGYRALNRNIPPACSEVKRRFTGLRFLGDERYGTGAVVDATAPIRPNGVTFALALAPDRRWKILDAYATEQRTAETKAKDQIPFDTAADDWLAAVRTRNCKQFAQVADYSVEGATSEQQACDTVLDDPQVVPEALRSASVEPELLGGNARFQFYALRFEPHHYGTIVAVLGPRGTAASVATPLYLS